jgi:hypothetical protein
MIYRTTVAFIFTLFLTQIARALPHACSDYISPASKSVQHPLQYGDAPRTVASVELPAVVRDVAYDNSEGSMENFACSGRLASKYPKFKDIPNYPFVAGTLFVDADPDNICGNCWKLTNLKNNASIEVTFIDQVTEALFSLGSVALNDLEGGGGEVTEVLPKFISEEPCGFLNFS